MSSHAIVSYDDTLNDYDALMLGRLLGEAGAELTLVYVRHSFQNRPNEERLEEHDAQALLERGARLIGNLDVDRRVVISPSTAEGLRWLAEQEDAEIVVFGSDYRTAARHVSPQKSAQTLLEGGRAAVAIAPANFSAEPSPKIRTVGVFSEGEDHAVNETAHQLAEHFGATVADRADHVDLLVVGSRPEAPHGHVLVSARAQNAIEESTAPVLVVARGVPLRLGSPVAA
jgi:nucleotide-binding universal stress UspA family protein